MQKNNDSLHHYAVTTVTHIQDVTQLKKSFIWHSVKVEKFGTKSQQQISFCPRMLSSCDQIVHWPMCTASQGRAITWFCCQTSRWRLRPNLPLASCGPGSGPINPLRPFVCFCLRNWTPQWGLGPAFRGRPLRSLWSIAVPRIIEITVHWV